MNPRLAIGVLLTGGMCAVSTAAAAENGGESGIRPWTRNPWFWEYRGKPVLLVGGSNDDNLFQWPAEKLDPHLDLLKACGGNYIRNTMSDRKDKGFEVYAFRRLDNGKYDLNQWNPEYWKRFTHMLEATARRGIIVQIEVWDRFDYTDVGGCNNWQRSPWNPANNVNYTFKDSGFAPKYPEHPGMNRQPFFFTTPNLRDNKVVFPYQKRFVDKMLSCTLKYDHVLYCMDNETSGAEGWGAFWARYIKQQAAKHGKTVYVTEMWDDWDLHKPRHRRTFDHPELYDFVDISQNNQMKGQRHWDNFQWARAYLAKKKPRPMNTVKTYGADGFRFGNSQDGLERFWQHVIGGIAAARFHRPPAGLGLSTTAQNSIRTVRAIEKFVRFWDIRPCMKRLSNREKNEAYAAGAPGKAWLVLFSNGGAVRFDLRDQPGAFDLRWVEIRTGKWSPEPTRIDGGRMLPLEAPGKSLWLALLTPAR